MGAHPHLLINLTGGSVLEEKDGLKNLLTISSEPVDIDQIEAICRKTEYRYARQARRMYGYGKYDALFRTSDPKSEGTVLAKQRHRLRGLAALEDTSAEIHKARAVLELNLQGVQRDKDDENLLNTLEQYEKELALAEAEEDLLPLIALYGKSDRIKQELDQYEAKHKAVVEQKHSKIAPTTYFYDHPAGYWLVCVLIYCAEIVVNYPAVVNLGEISNSLALVFCVAISALMSITAMMSGTHLQRGKIWSGMFWGLAGLALCVGVMALRWDQNVVLTFVVFVFYGITLLLSFAKAKNYAFYQCKRQIGKLKPRLHKALTANARIETACALREKQIKTQYEGQTGTLSMTIGRVLQHRIDEFTGQLVKLDILQKQVEDRINSLFAEGCLNYDRGYIFISRALFRRPIPELLLNGTTVLPKLMDENPAASNGQAVFKAAKCLILLTVCTFLLSCTPPATHDITVLIDQTHGHQIKAPELTGYVFSQLLKLDQRGMRDEMRLTVSTIGETSKQPAKRLELPRGDPWISRRDIERRRQIGDFSAAVDSLVLEAMNTKDSLVYSFIYHNIAIHLNRLAALPADVNRNVVILSDLLHHTPELSVYRNPELLDDFAGLADRLTQNSSLPSCGGVAVHIVYVPDRKTDAVFSKSLEFFTGLYENCGAQVTYVPGLH